jgi:hypothetical protein
MKLNAVQKVKFKQNMEGWKRNTFVLTTKCEENLTYFVLKNPSSFWHTLQNAANESEPV